MSSLDKLEKAIMEYMLESGRSPKAIYMTRKTLGDLAFDLGPMLTHRMHKCPHCGKSLVVYKGTPIEILEDGDVVAGESCS